MRSKVLKQETYLWQQWVYDVWKRSLELVFSISFLILTLPVLLITALLIKLESRGPVLYKQERVGLDGKPFSIVKFRSMRTDAEKNGPQWAAKNDPRVTRIGRFIRKTRIDEVPQLLNILRGEMSLIGPRPERDVFIERFSEEIPDFRKRLLVKPGLTGWAQVNGGYDITPKEKFELDMYYVQRRSIGLDIVILYRTVWVVLSGTGAR
ncbi:sugar transferase [Mechercharimyces sp. CAU 1602]|uniref:sugar transferase n=1 Tax=Mechercharimyces sp. CAU 1602 TaxID=2973933 RepID=UPI002161DB9B|nr:sugar transferase [Mechercharimyces sp. CAU 1602]MCS1352246.1 sugar transferase [Mechercharimyces sp. CAU 1602]